MKKVRDPGILDARKDLHLAESFWGFPLRGELPSTNIQYKIERKYYFLIWVDGKINKLNFLHLTLVMTNF